MLNGAETKYSIKVVLARIGEIRLKSVKHGSQLANLGTVKP